MILTDKNEIRLKNWAHDQVPEPQHSPTNFEALANPELCVLI
jgi:hypothetical protein